jgi:hypothetical protein
MHGGLIVRIWGADERLLIADSFSAADGGNAGQDFFS